ncbi:DUF5947 family protein [Streptomyces sp. NPDC005438]|uniref:DUF5947 family protein n=1 Tax=Streptomyces sp. NPDC005438 TaxID=3156880 RepID=UPI0033B71D1E
MTGLPPSPRLRRLASRAAPPGPTAGAEERCDLCAEPLPGEHRHLLDLQSGEPACACRPCSLLFDREVAGGDHYQLLPEGRQRLDIRLDDQLWAALGVPVDLVFFTRDHEGAVLARYPSPLGTLRADVPEQVWSRLLAEHPELADLAPSVEALLTYRTATEQQHWRVPVDVCFQLAALVRAHWDGISGGKAVHQRIRSFLDQLTPAPGTPAGAHPRPTG